MIIIRFILVSLIIYLIIRSFVKLGKNDEPSIPRTEPGSGSKITSKKVSKEVGEYVDYEEVDN
jgi:hypothetical protein